MDIHNQKFYDSCLELGLDVELFEDIEVFRLSIGNGTYLYRNGETPINDCASSKISYDKYLTNKILEQSGLPVVKSIIINKADYENNHYSLSGLTFPVVAKPCFGTCSGQDVICGIENDTILKSYLNKYLALYDKIIIEEQVMNLKSYRVLMLHKKVIALMERIPAKVIGDGEHTLSRLVKDENKARLTKMINGAKFSQIILNEETMYLLNKRGLDLSYIPEKDEVVTLRYVCNWGQGGTVYSPPINAICKENVELAIAASEALNLDFVGFDMFCEDISIPIAQSKGVIIEANCNPAVRMHEVPQQGKAYYVTKDVLKENLALHPWVRAKRMVREHYVKAVTVILICELFWHAYLRLGAIL